jgi:hypothetical protein
MAPVVDGSEMTLSMLYFERLVASSLYDFHINTVTKPLRHRITRPVRATPTSVRQAKYCWTAYRMIARLWKTRYGGVYCPLIC